MADDGLTEKQKDAICVKYHKLIVENLDARFSDTVTSLCEVALYSGFFYYAESAKNLRIKVSKVSK
jgi:hypothetical protein